ncbi:glycosyltransferase [Pseudazoarcus pumilus]|uniref:Glycosyl transferase family 1 domain-containing protein n=1 Tax=Pseudazoarcus pumilus TaxID=2067960 RepID=A0A2I6S8X9_9RHOO|nr:glycosyltransferase [Pseudazoarcus pumilus]AUN95719.1 hypothetical protein C0099_12720 [Pseudazoarcus pumilus]
MHARFIQLEFSDFDSFPEGGQTTSARQTRQVFGDEVALVGITCDDETPTGIWTRKVLDGTEHDFFALARVRPSSRKPLIPMRASAFLALRRYRRRILAHPCRHLLIRAPEVLMGLGDMPGHEICLHMPGVENPLKRSRYWYGRLLAERFQRLFLRRLGHVDVALAAADEESIRAFSEECARETSCPRIAQFPTRFDEQVFYPRDRITTRHHLQISSDAPVLVGVGRLNRFKGWALVIQAFVEFRYRFPEALLFILGEGEERAALQRQIADNALERHARLLGHCDQETVAAYMSAATFVVSGSSVEGWSTTLVEAIACEVPVCTTEFSSARELVQDGINGYVVTDRTPAGFSAALVDCLGLPREGLHRRACEISDLAVARLREALMHAWPAPFTKVSDVSRVAHV